jgi:hypothetical protein
MSFYLRIECIFFGSLIGGPRFYTHSHMIIKEMFYIPIKLKPELARASMMTSDVNNHWRSNFQHLLKPYNAIKIKLL